MCKDILQTNLSRSIGPQLDDHTFFLLQNFKFVFAHHPLYESLYIGAHARCTAYVQAAFFLT